MSVIRRTLAVACAALIVAGCSGAQMDPFATGDLGGGKTIDPSYKLPVEESRRAKAEPMKAYLKRAATVAMEDQQVYGAVVHLSKLYESDPRDKKVAYDYARHLRYIGAHDEAARVLNDAAALHPGDALLRLETAKLHIARGESGEALALLEKLRAERPEDPAILQAKGVAQDRAGRHADAQKTYQEAIALGRPSAPLLNNAAMSHLLSGEPEKAEKLLRRAAAAPGATAQIQQNLALTLSLQGKSEEARRVAETSAPRAVVDPALEYYDSIASVSHAWSMARQ